MTIVANDPDLQPPPALPIGGDRVHHLSGRAVEPTGRPFLQIFEKVASLCRPQANVRGLRAPRVEPPRLIAFRGKRRTLETRAIPRQPPRAPTPTPAHP